MSASPVPQATAGNPILKMALAYRKKGFKVLPCNLDKSPAIDGGFTNASGDPDQIRHWFSDVEFQLAIACELSGLVVVDADDLPALQAHLLAIGKVMPETFTVRTPSGGLHYYFRAIPGTVYPGKLCAGVDLKWKGYVMAPPSQAYSTRLGDVGKYSISLWVDIAPAPDWLAKPVSPARTTPPALATQQAPDYQEIYELLQYIDPDLSYGKWLNVLMAVHGASCGSSQGMHAAIEWSARGTKFKAGEVERKWPSFGSHKGLTIASLAAMAKENGADVAEIARRANRRRQDQLMADRRNWDFAGLDLTNVTPMWTELDPEVQDEMAVTVLLAHTTRADCTPTPPDGLTLADNPVLRRAEQFRHVLLSADKAKANLRQNYLIKHILLRSSVAMIFGPSGTGKTFYALAMANCIAGGWPFGGHKVFQGVVIYVSAEGTGSIGNRLTALSMERSPNLKVLPLAIDLHSNDIDLSAILALGKHITAETGEKIALVVIDTLARSFGGGDENAASEMNKVVGRITALKEALDTTVLIVHHTGKDAERGARGSSALNAAMETTLEIKRSDKAGVIQVRASKQRDLEADWSHCFELVTVELGEDEDGDPVTSCRIEFVSPEARARGVRSAGGPIQKMVLARLSEYAATHGTEHQVEKEGDPVTVRKVNRDAFQASIIQPHEDGTKNPLVTRNVNDAINKLVKRGALGEADGAIWLNP